MATKTQFLPYGHRYQDSTAGLRDALTNIQTGMNQRGAQRVAEADQKIRQNEADRLAGQRDFLSTYTPTLTTDHLTNEGFERFTALLGHADESGVTNQQRLDAMPEDERNRAMQGLLRETADAGRVARTVREDAFRSGLFDAETAETLATVVGSGYRDFATESLDEHKQQAEDAKNRATMFSSLGTGFGRMTGASGTSSSKTGTGGLGADMQAFAGEPDDKGYRPGYLRVKYNNMNDPDVERYTSFFGKNDPRLQEKIAILKNNGLVTYQPNYFTREVYEQLRQAATENESLGWLNNMNTNANVTQGVKTWLESLNNTKDGDGMVAAPPMSVILKTLEEGLTESGLLTDKKNIVTGGVRTDKSAGRIAEALTKAHEKYLDGRGKEQKALLEQMGKGGFDFYNTDFPELNGAFYNEAPTLNPQQRMAAFGRTNDSLGAMGAQLTAGQPQNINVSPEKLAGREKFSSPQEFTAAMMPMAQQAAQRLGVDPKYLVAQAGLETGWGTSMKIGDDGLPSFNLFGVKSHGWKGKSDTATTSEFVDGKMVKTNDSFRKYDSFADSFNDYVNFLEENPRYKKALQSVGNGEEFVKELKAAGYATDPDYVSKVLGAVGTVERTGIMGGGVMTPQQVQSATEPLRAIMGTYPQPYTPKSFTYDRVDDAFRRGGFAVSRDRLVEGSMQPVAAGLGWAGATSTVAPERPPAVEQPITAAAPSDTSIAGESEDEMLQRQLRAIDRDFLARREANLTGGNLEEIRNRLLQEQGSLDIAQLQENARNTLAAAQADIAANERAALAAYRDSQPVQGDLVDIALRAGPGRVQIGPFSVGHLPTDRNIERLPYEGDPAAAWRGISDQIVQGRDTAQPQPLVPRQTQSLPEQREAMFGTMLQGIQTNQAALREAVGANTNTRADEVRAASQEAAGGEEGASQEYDILANLIRQFQEQVGNQQMTLGNIA